MNTKQQEFDAVVQHLYKQGRPARISRVEAEAAGTGICLYRSKDANGKVLSCAVGCRIPDAIYTPEMEQYGGVFSLTRRIPIGLPPEFYAYEDMFSMLQGIHDESIHDDDAFNLDHLEVRLKEAADALGLTFTVPEVTQ